jgi:hypothetical protein
LPILASNAPAEIGAPPSRAELRGRTLRPPWEEDSLELSLEVSRPCAQTPAASRAC